MSDLLLILGIKYAVMLIGHLQLKSSTDSKQLVHQHSHY